MYPSPNKAMNRPPLGPSAPGSFRANQPGKTNQNGQGPANPYKGGQMTTPGAMHSPMNPLSPASNTGYTSPSMGGSALTPPSMPPASSGMSGENPSTPDMSMGAPPSGMANQHQMQPPMGDMGPSPAPGQSSMGGLSPAAPSAASAALNQQNAMNAPSMPPPPVPYQRQDMPNRVQQQRRVVPQSQ